MTIPINNGGAPTILNRVKLSLAPHNPHANPLARAHLACAHLVPNAFPTSLTPLALIAITHGLPISLNAHANPTRCDLFHRCTTTILARLLIFLIIIIEL